MVSRKWIKHLVICLAAICVIILLGRAIDPTTTSVHKQLLISDVWESTRTNSTITFYDKGTGIYFDGKNTYSFRWLEPPESENIIQLNITRGSGMLTTKYELMTVDGVPTLIERNWNEEFVRKTN